MNILRTLSNAGKHSDATSLGLLFLRLAVGIFMLTHGWSKAERLFGEGPVSFADPLGMGETTSLVLTVFSELVCSILIILGLFTRAAAFPLLFTMLVAAFIVHKGDPIGDRELAFLYAGTYLLLMLSGAGKYSVDKLISK